MKRLNFKLVKVLAFVVIRADFKTVEKKYLEQNEDPEKVTHYLAEFKRLRDQQKIKETNEKDIEYWGKKPFKDLVEFVEELVELSTEMRQLKQKNIKGAKLIASNEKWYVFAIYDYEAAKFLADKTEWCIKHENNWKSYSEFSDFYFFISKDRTDDWRKIALQVQKGADFNDKYTYWDAKDTNHSSYDLQSHNLELPKIKISWNPRVDIGGKNIRVDLVDELPANTKIEGDLQIKDTPLTKLPDGLHVTKLLDLTGSEIKELPKKLKVYTLRVSNLIKEIPDDIQVTHLDLTYSGDIKLPDNLACESLVLYSPVSESQITKLPDGLKIGNLDLKYTNIEELPERLYARILRLGESKITKLPEDSKCELLDLRNSKIVEIPAKEYEEILIDKKSSITKLPDGLSIFQDFDITKTNITELPKKFSCDRLVVPSTIKELPSGLNVNKLDLKNTSLTELPADLQVRELDISNTKIDKLPKENSYETLNIRGTPITELPDNLEVQNLDIRDTEITKLPNKMHVVDRMYLNNKITELPDDLVIGKRLFVRENQLKEIPKGLENKIIEIY